MIIRPVQRKDTDAVLKLAKAAGIGMTSLPADQEVLGAKVERAVQSFAGTLQNPEEALFFFVMEDSTSGEVVGTCGIEAHVGLKRPMYSYKVVTVTQYSDTLDIYSRNDMLQMVNDYAGVSEIGSLFLLPEYRRDGLGRFLSRVRFLFMALYPQCFDTRVVAEIRGWHDGKGNSPFYDALARKFFQIDFHEADWLCATKGNRFISELMPTYPIYVSLLPQEAQELIGRAYVNSEPAKAMLEREGFACKGYVDIFDGGPTLEARVEDIHTVRQTKHARVASTDVQAGREGAQRAMLCIPGMETFRACAGFILEHEVGAVALDAASAARLGVQAGDSIAYAC